MSDLTSLTTPTRLDAQTFELDVPDGWQQGRGAFGGLVLASLARAIESCDEGGPSNGRRLRSLTAEICGPVLTGINTIRVERLRTGTGVSTLAARLGRDGEVLAHMVGILGRPRAEGTDLTALAPPVMPPWREVPAVRVERSFGPRFAERFEFRPVGALPFLGGPEALAAGWIRPRNPGPARDAGYVTAMADAWWPAIFTCFMEPRPIATVAFTLELLDGTEGLDPDAPLFHSARAVASRDGYVVELRELRGEDGRVLALNQQTLTIIK